MTIEYNAQIVTGAKGVVHLRPVPDDFKAVKRYMAKQAENKIIRVIHRDKELSKSERQNKTFHLLWSIYWSSGCASDKSKTDLRNRLKYEHGITEFFTTSDGKVIASLKSVAGYTLSEGRQLISGTIAEMIQVFADNAYSVKRFDEMIEDWNDFNKNT